MRGIMTTLESPVSETATGSVLPATPQPAQARSKPPLIRRHLTDKQICVLMFDRPDSSANIFDMATLTELNEHLDAIESDSQIRGLVLASAKKSIFIAGADLHSLSQRVDDEAL